MKTPIKNFRGQLQSMLALTLVALIIFSCKKDNPAPVMPNLFTTAVTAITQNTASSGGNISTDGGSAVTERGVCYAIHTAPTIADNKVINGSGTGNFNADLTGLVASTTYYVRAYATNKVGTAYGNEVSFKTTADVYVVGTRNVGAANDAITVWKNGTPTNLSDGSKKYSLAGTAGSGSDVYVLANYNPNGNSQILLWKNGGLQYVTDGTKDISATGITISGNDVYISGYLSDPVTGQVAAYWKNGVETKVGLGTTTSIASAIAVSGADIYVSGQEWGGNNYVAKYWKNGVAIPLTDGSGSAEADAIAVVGDDVYVAGKEHFNNNTQVIARVWKNGVASALTDGTANVYVYAMTTSGSDVYVTGTVANATQTAFVGNVWKNGVATALPFANQSTEPYGVAVSIGDVYVAGGNDVGGILWKNGAMVSPFMGTDNTYYLYYVYVTK